MMLTILILTWLLVSTFIYFLFNSDWTATNGPDSGFTFKCQFSLLKLELKINSLKANFETEMPTTSIASTPPSPSSSQDEEASISGCSDEGPQQEGTMSSAMKCSHCVRSGGPLFCHRCGFFCLKGRLSKPCRIHPKVIFYSDFKACPKCKTVGHLRELD